MKDVVVEVVLIAALMVVSFMSGYTYYKDVVAAPEKVRYVQDFNEMLPTYCAIIEGRGL